MHWQKKINDANNESEYLLQEEVMVDEKGKMVVQTLKNVVLKGATLFKFLNNKGQGLVEFALILAFCAGIGYAANETGFAAALSDSFYNTVEVALDSKFDDTKIKSYKPDGSYKSKVETGEQTSGTGAETGGNNTGGEGNNTGGEGNNTGGEGTTTGGGSTTTGDEGGDTGDENQNQETVVNTASLELEMYKTFDQLYKTYKDKDWNDGIYNDYDRATKMFNDIKDNNTYNFTIDIFNAMISTIKYNNMHPFDNFWNVALPLKQNNNWIMDKSDQIIYERLTKFANDNNLNTSDQGACWNAINGFLSSNSDLSVFTENEKYFIQMMLMNPRLGVVEHAVEGKNDDEVKSNVYLGYWKIKKKLLADSGLITLKSDGNIDISN